MPGLPGKKNSESVSPLKLSHKRTLNQCPWGFEQRTMGTGVGDALDDRYSERRPKPLFPPFRIYTAGVFPDGQVLTPPK